MKRCDLCAQEAVGSDYQRRTVRVAHIVIDHQQVIAEFIIFIEIASLGSHLRSRSCRHFFVEDAIAQPLCRDDFPFGLGDTYFETNRRSQNRPCQGAPLGRNDLVNRRMGSGILCCRGMERAAPAELNPPRESPTASCASKSEFYPAALRHSCSPNPPRPTRPRQVPYCINGW